MARKKPQVTTAPPARKLNSQVTPTKKFKPQVRPETTGDDKRLKNAERSAYFARREAAKVLRTVLQGDARRRAVGSIKSLVLSPSIRNKKATFALVCQTLKYLPILKEVMEAIPLNSKWKKQMELMYMITYDILFGQEDSLTGDAERYLLLRKDSLQLALAKLLASKKVKHVNDLKALYKISEETKKPRYVRVNTLKIKAETALQELEKHYVVEKDDLVPNLFKLPPGTDLHDHPLVKNMSLILQGKASSMVSIALAPKPGWEVIDACAAPGNKTIHLAGLMKKSGSVVACELDRPRFERLKETVKFAGAINVLCKYGDFLDVSPEDPSFSQVRAILLDPSCSGSGTVEDRLDHLLPSYNEGVVSGSELSRVRKLAAFQRKMLEHALSFPGVERIVYSTCSVNQVENEDVVKSVLPVAESFGFHLETVFPTWPRRGLPIFDGCEHLVRTDIAEDKEGFFIALFVRKRNEDLGERVARKRKRSVNSVSLNLCKMLLS